MRDSLRCMCNACKRGRDVWAVNTVVLIDRVGDWIYSHHLPHSHSLSLSPSLICSRHLAVLHPNRNIFNSFLPSLTPFCTLTPTTAVRLRCNSFYLCKRKDINKCISFASPQERRGKTSQSEQREREEVRRWVQKGVREGRNELKMLRLGCKTAKWREQIRDGEREREWEWGRWCE